MRGLITDAPDRNAGPWRDFWATQQFGPGAGTRGIQHFRWTWRIERTIRGLAADAGGAPACRPVTRQSPGTFSTWRSELSLIGLFLQRQAARMMEFESIVFSAILVVRVFDCCVPGFDY